MLVFLLVIIFIFPQGVFSIQSKYQHPPGVYDVVVYGGSSGGVMAAVQAARMGKSVILIEPSKHLGGMTSSGLGFVDANKPRLIGGLTREYFHRVWFHYQKNSNWVWEPKHDIPDQHGPYNSADQVMWTVEPHVAEMTFCKMIQELDIVVLMKQRINRAQGVIKKGEQIVSLLLESGLQIRGRVFIDASYEGDLMAAAAVSFVVGRESNAEYNEKYNGVQYNISPTSPLLKIDPFNIQNDPSSGLLPRVFPMDGKQGKEDTLLQAYGFRMCLTDHPDNRISIPMPNDYDEANYELVLRAVESGYPKEKFFKLDRLPNCKTDSNNSGPISTDYIGMNWDWVSASYEEREEIARQHESWQRGLLWTLQNHPRVPQELRDYFGVWGLPKDEFQDNNHWPYMLYVREARRMVSHVVINEHTALGKETVCDSVGLATYCMDSHYTKYCVNADGKLLTEGGLYVKIPKPFPISYQAIVPKRSECKNLLVPVCLSASHAAYGSIRMEPQFMILGESAATAACLALDLKVPVQDVPYNLLQQQLLQSKQVLALPSDYGKKSK